MTAGTIITAILALCALLALVAAAYLVVRSSLTKTASDLEKQVRGLLVDEASALRQRLATVEGDLRTMTERFGGCKDQLDDALARVGELERKRKAADQRDGRRR